MIHGRRTCTNAFAMIATTLRGALNHYTLYRQLAPETVAWYARAVSVFCSWAGGDIPIQEFNGERISQMLLHKQRAGCSAYYVKSLRGGLVALLREVRGDGPIERVRSVRTPPLDPAALTPREVERLLKACYELPIECRWRYTLMILLGYYTGLDASDIWRIERKHIDSDGSIFFRRGKTGAPVFVRIPPDVVELVDRHCPSRGRIIVMGVSREWFRKTIRGIFDRAKLRGSFKTLRKSAGSLVEQASPGTGHKHLGNTRAIFEKHYESHRITRGIPTMPPLLSHPDAG